MKKRRVGRPSLYLDRIKALKVGKSTYFAGAEMSSIKSIAWRTGEALNRTFSNRSEDGGVVVYREK